MKSVSLTSIFLSALALGTSSLVNAQTVTELREFATSLGLSQIDTDILAAEYGSNTSKRTPVTDLSCQLLEMLFPDNTAVPTEASAYSSKVQINWSTRAWLNGKCVFSPRNTQETATGVKIANFFKSQFAIRSGGHSPDPYLASIDDGILFSLDLLNKREVDPVKNIASIGPGNRWGQVYTDLGAKGFVVVGGRVSPVGVGGLLTGGGLSYFSGTEGFAADNVINYEVVLADGRIVNANAKENPDLWWALKGGGNNFGIVTRFDLKAIPKPNGNVWGGTLAFSPEKYPEVLKAIAQFQNEGQIADPKAAIIPSFVSAPFAQTVIFLVTIFHQDPLSAPPAALKPLLDIPSLQNTGVARNLSNLAIEAYGLAQSTPPARQYFRDTSIFVSPEFYQWALELYTATFQPLVESVENLSYVITYQPISTVMVDAGLKTGGHPIDSQRRPHTWLLINPSWTNPKDDQLIISTCKAFLQKVEAKAKELNLYDSYIYLNDAAGDQPVMRSYGEENFNRLRKISQKYDPQQVFQKQVTGGFKLN